MSRVESNHRLINILVSVFTFLLDQALIEKYASDVIIIQSNDFSLLLCITRLCSANGDSFNGKEMQTIAQYKFEAKSNAFNLFFLVIENASSITSKGELPFPCLESQQQ